MSAAATGRAPERIFRPHELPTLPAEPRPGLYVLVERDCVVPDSSSSHVTALPSGQHVVHIPERSSFHVTGVRDTAGVCAITVVGHTSGVEASLALGFAEHLRTVRSGPGSITGPFVTSSERDPFGSMGGLVKSLHFLTVDVGDTLADRALWEWSTPSDAATLLGAPPDDLERFHDHIGALLALRQAARESRLPDTADGHALNKALRGRYFSGRFLAEHAQLIWRLLSTITTWRTSQ